MAEKEKKQKQEIPAMRGTFAIRGIVTTFDKVEGFTQETKKGNTMRRIRFNVSSSEGNIHSLQLQAFQTEYVYFSGREKQENGEEKNVVEQVKWNDRLKYRKEGFTPIDRISYGLKKVVNPETNREENERHTKLTYDAIEDIYNLLEVGMSVYVRGNIQVEEYTAQNGEKRNTTRLIPTQISLTGAPIDFNAEDFKEEAVFELGVIAEDIEFSGTQEATVTGLFIGNQRMGRQTLVVRNDESLKDNPDFDLENLLTGLRNVKAYNKSYVYLTFVGNMINAANRETVETEAISNPFGFKDTHSPLRSSGRGFRREFLCTGVVEELIDTDTYTPENVDQFISQFINPKQEFADATPADDFAF